MKTKRGSLFERLFGHRILARKRKAGKAVLKPLPRKGEASPTETTELDRCRIELLAKEFRIKQIQHAIKSALRNDDISTVKMHVERQKYFVDGAKKLRKRIDDLRLSA